MPRIEPSVETNFVRYELLRRRRKEILLSPIIVNQLKPSNRNFKIGHSPGRHSVDLTELEIEVEVKILDTSTHHFKIYSRHDFPFPFFRYDSGGPPHFNRHLDIPLQEQKVDTPHYHEFDSQGIEFAFRTPSIDDPQTATEFKDPSLSISHFCNEADAWFGNVAPLIDLHGQELPFNFNQDDPLTDINFE